ncbi:MAG: nitroreductase family protein [Candidatus Omnitrophota bacterium]
MKAAATHGAINNMEILEIIRSRRSIREYAEDIPKDEEIEKILEAGRWAPSGLNNQPWRFLCIVDKAKKDGLAAFTKYGKIIKDAPMALVVCMDVSDSYNRDKDLMAIGACIENMLLEAHALGLGACWLGEILNKKGEVAKYLKLDADLELTAVLALGKPEEAITESCRKNLKNLMI